MGRFLLSQLRYRQRRTATLGAGILVAAVSFTLLTSAVQTSALEVQGSVAENWDTAYHILVRPQDSFTDLEREQGLVRENYLGGIFGGITEEQYREVLGTRGVEVAAPIANLGYVAPYASIPVEIGDVLTEEPVQLYRLRYSWSAQRGLSRYPGATDYVYYTRANPFVVGDYGPQEVVAGREEPLDVCGSFNRQAAAAGSAGPFDTSEPAASLLQCFSSLSPEAAGLNLAGLPEGSVGSVTSGQYPVLVAAIDPVQEDRLLQLGDTLVSGRALRAGEGATLEPIAGSDTQVRTVPVIAATKVYVDQDLQVQIERLEPPAGTDVAQRLASDDAAEFLSGLPGVPVATREEAPGPIYEQLLERYSRPSPNTNGYWSSSSAEYRRLADGSLVPKAVDNPEDVWDNAYVGDLAMNTANGDRQFRRLDAHPYAGDGVIEDDVSPLPGLRVVGRYDPEKLPGFNALSRVPLETYHPPQAEAADAATRQALGGQPLLPTMNLGDYITQPPLILTTLEAASVLFDAEQFQGANERAPISVIRVRVAGASGPDPVSRERIRQVATAIVDATGLAVDITAGSSPQPQAISLPEGRYGRPPLALEEGWVKKGVAVAILTAVDRKSLVLFLLVLVASSLFLANGAFASVRARRTEIGTLLCLGWPQQRIFAVMLGELALIGLLAGLLGTALAVALVRLLSLDMPLVQAALVTPVSVGLAVLAGLVPAWRAARSGPLDAVRPQVLRSKRRGSVGGLAQMAVTNLIRVPGRTLVAAVSLFIGVTALTVLLTINLAFQGAVVGTLLGSLISVEVRAVDYLAVMCVIVLGGLSVGDVLFLNLRERAPEFATLRSAGWRESHLAGLVAVEGLALGVLGSLAGVGIGALLVLLVGGPAFGLAAAGAIAGVVGVAVALIASLVPVSLMGRMTPPSILAEDG